MPTLVNLKAVSLTQIRDLLGAKAFCGEDLSPQVEHVVAADLMSDVLIQSKRGMLLLTSLASPQVIRTALVAGLCGVVFVQGRTPDESVLALARERKIPLLGTPLPMFEAVGLLYMAMSGR